MIIDELETEGRDGRATSSARLRWAGGEFRLGVTMPSEFARGRPDASPFLSASILLAMRLGEDLDVRGPVSRPLLARVARIVDLYSRWDPRLSRTRMRAAGELEPAPRASGIGCFLSRGVDAMYSAASPRETPGPLSRLVFCDRLEPIHSAFVRAEELRLAGEAAARLGLPLVVIESNIRELTDEVVGDWEDMVGAGLSFLGTSMSGGLGHIVIPSSDGAGTVGPCGTSPLLDPMFSTAEVEVEHDVPGTRPAKVDWIARQRPDLLPLLKVCYCEDRPDNCGRCSKCLLTMLALEATGRRQEATAFPREFDADALAAVEIKGPQAEVEFAEVERALRARGGSDELADLIVDGLERAAARPAATRLRDDSPGFRRRAARRTEVRRDSRAAPRTTVMMWSHEADATLREAVDSVLSQTVRDLELLVVDDASSTPVAALLADLDDSRLQILRRARTSGASAARNAALRAARAPLVSQLDADQVWDADYLEAVLPSFDDPQVGLVYANAGDSLAHPIDEFPEIAKRSPVPPATATMRASAVRAAGGYASWLSHGADYHLYMKLARAGWRFACVDRELARCRGRVTSHDARRDELWDHAVFASFVARHPRTPGPRRQLRVRARSELEHALAVARQRLAPPAGGRPRLLVEPGSHAMLNLGDIAMAQVCVERLQGLWPDAAIGVVTEAPDRLGRYCPGVEAVPASGQSEWFAGRWHGGAYWPFLPGRGRTLVERSVRRLGDSTPRLARAAVRAELVAREPASAELRKFASWLLSADAVVVSGRGGTTDAFLDDGMELLELVHSATALGIPTAMFSQGLGPIEDEDLRSRAGAVLPRVDVLAVRERRSAIPLLHALGVRAERVALTGDDAVELAYRLRPNGVPRHAIGVGLRLSTYSGLTPTTARTIGHVLRAAAARRGSELRALPISLHPHDADHDSLSHVLDRQVRDATSAREAIVGAGGCRVVVAGSYHAAVFALAQGVPVVGLSATPYYDAKLEGLADLFPGGCHVLAARDPELGAKLVAALDDAWDAADELRETLLAAAECQIAAAHAAYAEFKEAVIRHAGLNRGAGLRTGGA